MATIDIPDSITSRNKELKSNRGDSYWGRGSFKFDKNSFWGTYDYTNPLRFLNLLKCYAERNKDSRSYLKLATEKHSTYWRSYINADECRSIAKFYRDARKRGTIYFIDQPFKLKDRWDEWKENKETMVITKRPYTEESLFMKALMEGGIRAINGKEKHFFDRVTKFLDKSQGVWLY